MKHRLVGAVLALVLLCAPLMSCSSAQAASSDAVPESSSTANSTEPEEEQPASVEEEAASESAEEENSVQLSEEEQEAAREKFQTVFEQMQMREVYEGQYADCTRYTVVSDYDGDGRLEAFGFVGMPSDWQPAPYWESICIYYIDADYKITSLLGDTSGYDVVNGGICCPEPYAKEDYSNCVYTSGKEHFLAWSVAYWEGDYFGLILSANNGKPVVSYLSSGFYVNDNGQFATFDDNYNEVLLQLKDGQMVNA